MSVALRVTTPTDAAAPPAIERSAGQRFLFIPELVWVIEDQVLPVAQHQTFVATGTSWLAQVDVFPVGFPVAETLGLSLFIAELSLYLEWRGKGVGRKSIEYVAEQTRRKGYTSLMLITFRSVTWNMPWYA